MGRRSISSTKTGKFMNPTDQARKEARRKELKKNKKQRSLVRQAVIKAKDPTTILNEIEDLDRMEFDTNNPPTFNPKVIQDKRRKLKGEWIRVFKYYEHEDPKLASELRGLEMDYEKRKSQIIAIYESVKKAEKVSLDEIPLPDAPSNQAALAMYQANEIPLPGAQKGILKKVDMNAKRKPPGPPPGLPPPLIEFQCEDDEKELGITASDNIATVLNKTRKIRFSDDGRSAPPAAAPPTLGSAMRSQYQMPPPPLPSAYQPPSFRPNAAAAAAHMSQPPPLPQQGYQNKPPTNPYGGSMQQASQRAPPPPHMLPPQQQQQKYQPPQQQQQQQQSSVLTGIPTRASNEPTSTTIEAKPVLRNKIAEITRFVPTSLMVRRDQKTSKPSQRSDDSYSYKPQAPFNPQQSSTSGAQPTKSTDAAYEQFMKEMSKLL